MIPLSPVWVIIIITVVLSFIGFNSQGLLRKSLFAPYDFIRGKRIYTIIASGFFHANWTHLVVNMFTFYNFAFQVEELLGYLNFIIFFTVSLIFSELGTLIKHRNNPHYLSLGASGAVAGVLFCYIIVNPTSTLMIFPIPIDIPAYIFAILYLVYSTFSAQKSNSHINHDAHIWGAVIGLLWGYHFFPQGLTILFS